MPTIKQITGREILDSRGRPTVQATCTLASGAHDTASVPSGASTGAAEAWELRDGDPRRYGGRGCRKAVEHVNSTIGTALADHTFRDQAELDQALIALDGTPHKGRLGANALLAVSLAFVRAVAGERHVPLYQQFADLIDQPLQTLPRPTINLFSGGKHAGGQVPIQDVLVVPVTATTIDDALAMTFAVYDAATRVIQQRYGMRALTADEGGLAPPFPRAEAMLDDAITAIQVAGFEPGGDMALALDVAATHFFQDGHYSLGDDVLSSEGMIARVLDWLDRYPIVSVEDGLAEDDWRHWPALRAGVGARALVLGDDLLCTNPRRIQRAIDGAAANALLLKVNQIGTITEAAKAHQVARAAGWSVTMSARSGETEDTWLADLAVGWAGDQIKIGSIRHGERLAKYNRLLAIAADTQLRMVDWPGTDPAGRLAPPTTRDASRR